MSAALAEPRSSPWRSLSPQEMSKRTREGEEIGPTGGRIADFCGSITGIFSTIVSLGPLSKMQKAAEQEAKWACAICTEPPDAPVSTPCCGQTFCSSCLTSCLLLKEECPLCTKSLPRAPPLAVNKWLQDVIFENNGPIIQARKKAVAFYTALEGGDVVAARDAFSNHVGFERVSKNWLLVIEVTRPRY